MKELHELKERLMDHLKDLGKRDLSGSTLSTIDTLTHTIKNLDKIIEGTDGYSNYYPDARVYRGSMRRDNMGRYSSDYGYSRTDIKDRLHELMNEAGDDRTRDEIKRLIEKM